MFDSEKFIKLIESYPVIYDTKCEDYSDRVVKASAWESISQAMSKNWERLLHYEKTEQVKNLQKKWKNIRDCFLKEYKIQRRQSAGGPASKRRKYIFYDHLHFLEPMLSGGRSFTTKPPFQKVDGEEFDAEDALDLQDSEEVSFVSQSRPNQPRGESSRTQTDRAGQRPRFIRKRSILERRIMDVLSGQANAVENETDDDKLFLLSLLPMMRRIPFNLKLEARIEMTQVIAKFVQGRVENPAEQALKYPDYEVSESNVLGIVGTPDEASSSPSPTLDVKYNDLSSALVKAECLEFNERNDDVE